MVVTIRKDTTFTDFMYENCCVTALNKRDSVEYEVKWHTGSFTQPPNAIVYEEPSASESMSSARPLARTPSIRSQTSRFSAKSSGALSQTVGALRRAYSQTFPTRSNSVNSVASRAWTAPTGSVSKLAISGPTGFRNMTGTLPGDDGKWKDPAAFRALQLSIDLPIGGLDPLPDFGSDDWAAKVAARLSIPPPAVTKAPKSKVTMPDINPLKSNPVENLLHSSKFGNFSRASRQDSMFYDLSAEDFPMIMSSSALPNFDSDMPTVVPTDDGPRLSRSFSQNVSSQFGRRSGSTPPALARSASERKQSSGPQRRNRLEDVEEEFRQLNTIMEERRQSALRLGMKLTPATPRQPARPDFSQFNFTSTTPDVQNTMLLRPEGLARQPSAVSPMMRARENSEGVISEISSVFSLSMDDDDDTATHDQSTYPSSAALVSPLLSPQPATIRHSFEISQPSRLQQQWSSTQQQKILSRSPYGSSRSHNNFGSQPPSEDGVPSTSTTLSNDSTPSNSIPSTPTGIIDAYALDELEELYQQHAPMQQQKQQQAVTAPAQQSLSHVRTQSEGNDSVFSELAEAEAMTLSYLPASTYSPVAVAAKPKIVNMPSIRKRSDSSRNESIDTNATLVSNSDQMVAPLQIKRARSKTSGGTRVAGVTH